MSRGPWKKKLEKSEERKSKCKDCGKPISGLNERCKECKLKKNRAYAREYARKHKQNSPSKKELKKQGIQDKRDRREDKERSDFNPEKKWATNLPDSAKSDAELIAEASRPMTMEDIARFGKLKIGKIDIRGCTGEGFLIVINADIKNFLDLTKFIDVMRRVCEIAGEIDAFPIPFVPKEEAKVIAEVKPVEKANEKKLGFRRKIKADKEDEEDEDEKAEPDEESEKEDD